MIGAVTDRVDDIVHHLHAIVRVVRSISLVIGLIAHLLNVPINSFIRDVILVIFISCGIKFQASSWLKPDIAYFPPLQVTLMIDKISIGVEDMIYER